MSDWYYAENNEQKGPINESELKANLATNKLPADALVWKDGMDAWTPANQVPAFTFRQPPAPAKVQPTAAPATTVAAESPEASNPDSTKPVELKDIMGKPEALEVTLEDAEQHKMFGVLAYLGPLFLVPLLAAKDSPYSKYHANQGLALFLVIIALSIAFTICSYIPFVGMVFDWLHLLLYFGIVVFVILGIVNAAAGKCVPLPLIGGIKLIK